MTQIPPAGPTLSFEAWVHAVVDLIAMSLPTVRATRTPKARSVTLRYSGASATIAERGDVFFITTQGAGGTVGMGALSIARHDAFTAGNVARTLIGYFEPSKSRRRDDA